MSDMTLIMCCSSTVLSLFFFSFVRWEEIVLVLLGHVLMTSMMTDETVLLFLYSAKRKDKGREFCSETEEDAAGGGEVAQPAGSRFTLHHR